MGSWYWLCPVTSKKALWFLANTIAHLCRKRDSLSQREKISPVLRPKITVLLRSFHLT